MGTSGFPFARSFLLTAPIFLPRVRERSEADKIVCVTFVSESAPQLELFQWLFVFTLMTLELGLVPLTLYARNR